MGQGSPEEARPRGGMTKDTSPENLRKFLESDDPALVRMGLSMAKGTESPEELYKLIMALSLWDSEEGNREAAKELVEEIWLLANDLGYKEFVWQLSQPIYDDHVYYYQGTSVPSIDIIDFDFNHWHTTNDIVENCSPKGLFIVGNVLLNFIYGKDK